MNNYCCYNDATVAHLLSLLHSNEVQGPFKDAQSKLDRVASEISNTIANAHKVVLLAKTTIEKLQGIIRSLEDKLDRLSAEYENAARHQRALIADAMSKKQPAPCVESNAMVQIRHGIAETKKKIGEKQQLLAQAEAIKARNMQVITTLEGFLHAIEGVKRTLDEQASKTSMVVDSAYAAAHKARSAATAMLEVNIKRDRGGSPNLIPFIPKGGRS